MISFDKSDLNNLPETITKIYNFLGFKVIINSSIPYKLIDDIFFTTISTILIILFFIGYKIVQSNKINQLEVIKWSIIFSILMAVAIPSHSSDLYGYIARGAQQSLYHQNPYLMPVSKIKEYNTNPLFINFFWPYQPTTYGPIFIYITKAIVFLSNNNFFLSFFNFKLLNLTLYLLLLLFVIKKNKTEDIYLIGWNPLILIQGLWNCHNDLFSGVLIFFGLYLLKDGERKENYFWSMFCLTLAVGIKFVSLIIIPVVFFYYLKTKPERFILLNFILGLCSGIILILILSIDYLTINHEFVTHSFSKIINNIGLVHKSLIATVYMLIKYFCKWRDIDCDFLFILNLLKYLFYSAFGMFYLWVLLKRKADLFFDVALVLLIFLSFTIAKFHSWYLLNVIFLLPLLEKNILKKILVTLSMSHTYAITFLDQAKILNFISMTLLPTIFVFLRKEN